MKTLVFAIVSLCVLTLGCAKLDQKFTLNPDGSGSLWVQLELIQPTVETIKTLAKADPDMTAMIGMPATVPMTEPDVRALADDNVVVKDAKVEDLPDGGKKITASFEFKDIAKFAASKAAGFFAFELKKSAEGELQFTSIPFGFTPLLEMQDMEKLADRGAGGVDSVLSGLKLQFRGVAYHLEVALPGKIISTNSTSSKDNAAAWSLDVDKMTEKDLASIMPRAAFADAGFKFSLPLKTFKDMSEAFGEPRRDEIVPAHPADERFGVALEQLRFSKTVNFKNGKLARTDQNISGTLSVWFPEEFVAVAYNNLKIDEAATDTGESIAPKSRHTGFSMPISRWEGRTKGVFSAHLMLASAQKPVKSIKILKGTLDFQYAASVKTVRVRNLMQWLGKRIDLPELAGFDITLDKVEPKSLTLRYGKDTKSLIKSVTFKNGRDIELDSFEDDDMDDTCSYDVEFPEDGSITFEISQDMKNVTIPFELKDIVIEPEPEKLPF